MFLEIEMRRINCPVKFFFVVHGFFLLMVLLPMGLRKDVTESDFTGSPRMFALLFSHQTAVCIRSSGSLAARLCCGCLGHC